jgi:hypothetical protein
MKISIHLLRLTCAVLALPALGRADLVEQFTLPPRDCTPYVWFQAAASGAAAGHSGVLSLGSMPFGPNLYGGWLTFTPEGTFVSYLGGGSTHEVLTPGGAALADVRGAVKLAEAYGVIVDTDTGAIVGVTLYAGALLWTRTNTYLLLVGGIPTTYEFTVGGAPISGVRGAARLAANIIDTDPDVGVSATLFSGAAVYSPSHTYLLTTFGLGIAASEILFGGSSIAGVRGVTAMGGDANPSVLDSASFLWTPAKTLMLLTGGSVSVSEILDSSGASIAKTWGVTRQSPLYTGGGTFRGVVTVINDAKEHLVFVSGGVSVAEVLTPSGGSLTSNVNIPAGSPLLHQASNLSEVVAYWLRPGFPAGLGAVHGTVIGSEQ